MDNETKTDAGSSPVERPVRPCAWWVPAFGEPLVSRGEAKPMLWPEAKPLYELTAEEVAAVNKLRLTKRRCSRKNAARSGMQKCAAMHSGPNASLSGGRRPSA